MSVWVVCFVYIRFDLDIGPKAEYITPHDALTESGKNEIIKYAFPDCNPDCDHNFIFNFSLEDCTREAAQVIPETIVADPGKGSIISKLYGAAYYRQKYDTRVQRSYVQQAIVLLSRLPYIAVHELILRTVAPRFAQCCSLSPDTERAIVSSALSPFPSAFYHMDPSYNTDQYTQEQVLDNAIKEISEWPTPHPQVRYEVVLLHQVLVFVTGSCSFVPMQPREWQRHAVKRPPMFLDHRTTILGSQTPMGVDMLSDMVLSQDQLPICELLRDHIAHLTYLWELVISHEPLFILSNTPSTASAVAMVVASLVSPIPYTGVISSYFTTQSNEYARFSRMGKALPFPTTEGMIVAGTNPLLIRSFDGWPNMLAVVDRCVRTRGEEPRTTTTDLGILTVARQITPTKASLSPNRAHSPIHTTVPNNSTCSKSTTKCYKASDVSLSLPMRRYAGSPGASNGTSVHVANFATQASSLSDPMVVEKDKPLILPYGSFLLGDARSKGQLLSSPSASQVKTQTQEVFVPYQASQGVVCEVLDSSRVGLGVDPGGSFVSPQSSTHFNKHSRRLASCSSVNCKDFEEGRSGVRGKSPAFDSGRRYRLQSSSSSSSRNSFSNSDSDAPAELYHSRSSSNDNKRTNDSRPHPPPHRSYSQYCGQGVGTTVVPLIVSSTSASDVQPQQKSLPNVVSPFLPSGKACELKRMISHSRANSYEWSPTSSKHGLGQSENRIFTSEQYRILKNEKAFTPQKSISINLPKRKEVRGQLQHRLVNHFDSTFHFLLNHKEQTSYLFERLEAASGVEKEGQNLSTLHVDQNHRDRKVKSLNLSITSCYTADTAKSYSDSLFPQFVVANSVVRKFFDSLTHEFLSPITFWFMAITHNISSFSLCDKSVAESMLCANKFLDFFHENHRRITPGLWTRHQRYAKYKLIYERFARGSLFQAFVKRLLYQKLRKELDEFSLEEWVRAFPYETERIDMIINLYNVAKREVTHTLDLDIVFITSATSVLAKMSLGVNQPLQDQLLMKIKDLKL